MTADELNAIRARLAAATPGPWFAQPNDLVGGWCVRTVDAPPSKGAGEVADFIREEDARFIAAAPATIQTLIEEVEHLRGERAAVVAYLRKTAVTADEFDAVADAIAKEADAIERGEHSAGGEGTPPEPPGLLMEAHAFTVSDRSGPRLVVAREGEGWTVYRVTVTVDDDGNVGRHLTIARDGVRPDRLPATLIALLFPGLKE